MPEADIHDPSGIRTRYPSKRAAADPHHAATTINKTVRTDHIFANTARHKKENYPGNKRRILSMS